MAGSSLSITASAKKTCKRGALGVAIFLSSEARKAWERAGSNILYFGPMFLATRLRLHGTSRRRPLTLLLVSAYAPDSGKPQAEHEEYADALRRCFVACSRDILVVGTDTNSTLGVRSRHDDADSSYRDHVRGPFGILQTDRQVMGVIFQWRRF
jgi:hypothetical protein